MLYEGKTVHDALAQAMGRKKTKYPSKPSTYGKPIRSGGKTPSAGKLGAKPTKFGKQQDEGSLVNVTRDHLNRLRRDAESRARNSSLRNANLDPGALEEGFMSLYFTDTGEVRDFDGDAAGNGWYDNNGVPHFTYYANRYTSRPFWVLVWAHSHPKRSRNENSSYLRNLSADDRQLKRYAPVVIRHPGGTYPHRSANYQQYSR